MRNGKGEKDTSAKQLMAGGGETFRVDTLRNIVIIAIGGKIGNSTPLVKHPSEQERFDHNPYHQLQMCRGSGLPPRSDPGVGKRQIMDDFGQGASLGETTPGHS